MIDEDDATEDNELNNDNEEENHEEESQEEVNPFEGKIVDDSIIPVGGLYESWFLDYS